MNHSRNLVSIRLLDAIGIPYAIEQLAQFGFDKERLTQTLSLALGSAEISPLELTAGFAMFANGGNRVHPYLIKRIELSSIVNPTLPIFFVKMWDLCSLTHLLRLASHLNARTGHWVIPVCMQSAR